MILQVHKKNLGSQYTVHSDERNEKSTYVAVYGMDNALKAVKEYSEQALGILSNMPVQNSYLNTLARMLINRKK